MPLDFAQFGTPVDDPAPAAPDFSKFGTPVDEAPSRASPAPAVAIEPGDEFTAMRTEAATRPAAPTPSAPAPEAPPAVAVGAPREFNPSINPEDALALEATANKAAADTQAQQGPPRPGPTVEAAKQMERDRIMREAAAVPKPDFARAHAVAKAVESFPEPPDFELGRATNDFLQGLGAGTAEGERQALEAARKIAGTTAAGRLLNLAGNTVVEHGLGRKPAEILKDVAESYRAGYSPEAKDAGKDLWWDSKLDTFGPAWRNPNAYITGAAESLPASLAMVVPGASLARAAYAAKVAAGVAPEIAGRAAATAAGIAGSVVEGLLGAGQSSLSVSEKVQELKPEDLAKSDAYKYFLASGMTPSEAKRALAEDASTKAFVLGGIATGIFGGMGDRVLARAITTGIEGGVMKRMFLGAVSEGLFEEFPQNYFQQLGENVAVRGAKPDQPLAEDAMNQAMGGLAIGALQGGALAGAAGHSAAKPGPDEAAIRADEARTRALAKWEEFRQQLRTPQPEPAPRPDLAPVDFQRPDVPGMKAENLTASPGVAAAPVGNEIPFEGSDPTARAAAVERAQATETARQADLATRPGYVPPNLPQEKADRLSLAGDTSAPGNEIDAEPYMRELALLRASGLTMRDWLGGGDLLGRAFGNETIAILDKLEQLAAINPAAARDVQRAIDTFKEKADDSKKASPAPDAGALQSGEEAGRESGAAQPGDGGTPASATASPGAGGPDASTRVKETGNETQGNGSGARGPQPDGVTSGRSRGQEGSAGEEGQAGRGGSPREGEGRGARAGAEGEGDSAAQVLQGRAGIGERKGEHAGADRAGLDFSARGTPEVDHAAHQAATSPKNDLALPTEGQKDAGNYAKGHVRIAGLDVSIENPAGSKRRPAWPTLKSHYGYIRRSLGADGDHVDVFVKPGTPLDWTGPVFVVDQVSKNKKFDEHKVVLGAATTEEARKLYAANYTKDFRIGPITQMTLDQFKAWLASDKTKRAVKSLAVSEWQAILAPKKPLALVPTPGELEAAGYHDLTEGDRAAVDAALKSIEPADIQEYIDQHGDKLNGNREGITPDRPTAPEAGGGQARAPGATRATGSKKTVSPAGGENQGAGQGDVLTRVEVADAIARGETVAPEVLAKYPALAELAKAKVALAERAAAASKEVPEPERPRRPRKPAFRKAEPGAKGMDAQAVRDLLKPISDRARVAVRVVQAEGDVDGIEVDPGTRGVYHDGRIWIIADNIPNAIVAEATLAKHEFIHAGYDRLYGDNVAARSVALRDLQSKNRNLRERAMAWRVQYGQRFIDKLMKDDPRLSPAAAEREMVLRSMEESVAYFSEDAPALNGWRTFVAVIQKGLRRLGFTRLANLLEDATDAEAIAAVTEILAAVEEAPEASTSGDLQPAFARTGKEDEARLARAVQRMDEMVTMWEKGTLKDETSTHLGETPWALQLLGAPPLKLYINGAAVDKILRWKHGHQITPEMLRQIPAQLLEPALIFRPQDPMQRAHGGFMVVTELTDKTGHPIIVPIQVNKVEGRLIANTVASVYGYEEGIQAIESWAKKGDLLYYDQSKTAAPSSTLGQPPGEGRFVQVVQLGTAANPNVRSDADVVKKWGAMFARTTTSEALDFTGETNPPPGGTKPPPAETKPQNPGTPGSWQGPDVSRLDNVIYTLQDKHIDTKRVVRAIEATAGKLADQVDPYLQEELFHGRAAKQVADFLDHELKPLLEDVAKRRVKLADLEEYLQARHAEERNTQVARVNPAFPDGGSGMTTAEAKAVLARVRASGMQAAYDALASRVDAMTAKTRQAVLDYGLEAPSTIAAWQGAYKNYVPLYREEDDHGIPQGQGFSVRGPTSKRATGSSREVTNILANIAMQRERVIARGEKAVVGRALVGLATANPNPDFWHVNRPPMITYVDPRTGLAATMVDPLYKGRDNVIVVPDVDAAGNKVEHSIVFNERDARAMRMAQALKNLDVDQLGTVLGLIAKVTRYFASINTQYNPVFGLVNITRDTQEAMLNLTTTAIAGKQAEVLAHIPSALRGIYSDVRAERAGKPATSTWAHLFEEFQHEGGKTAYRDMFRTSDERTKAIEAAIKAHGHGEVKKTVKAVFDWLSDYNEAMENAVRLSAYKVAIESGLSKQRAASLAKNLTVNFNRKGQATTQASALYAFFNASVQGSARMAETLAGPKGRQIIVGGVLVGVLQAVALSMAGFDDGEPPDFVREKNLIFPIGNGKYLTIPMSLGFLIFPNLGRVATEYVLSGFKKPGSRAIDLFLTLLDSVSPVGGGKSFAQMLSPTVADPIVALAENRDWTGRAIAREDLHKLHPTPGYTRGKDTSTLWGKWIAQAINAASGGTAYKPGIFSPTPDQIDYLTGQITGGVGREIGKAWQTAGAAITGEDLPPYKIPIVGRLYGDAKSASAQSHQFYENLKEINQHAAELKGRRAAGETVADYLRSNPEANLVDQAKFMERRVGELQRERHKAIEQGSKEKVKRLEEDLARRMTQFNDRVKREQASAP